MGRQHGFGPRPRVVSGVHIGEEHKPQALGIRKRLQGGGLKRSVVACISAGPACGGSGSGQHLHLPATSRDLSKQVGVGDQVGDAARSGLCRPQHA